MRANAEVETRDEVSVELTSMLARLGELADGAADTPDVPDAVRIDRLALMEKLRAALVAAQHGEMVGFARGQVEAQKEEIVSGRLDPTKLGRGIADQIALACHVSPWTGSRRLGTARALHAELPSTRAMLRAGVISEDTAEKVVSETRHLDPELRRLVDKQLAEAGIDQLSPRKAAALARRRAYEADRVGYTERGRTARKDRRVTLRPAPDTMSVLSGLLPVEQGVACIAALRHHADAAIAAGDTRSRDQIQADALVERLTGQAQAGDVNVEVGITMPVEALVDPDCDAPAELVGHGPLPSGIVRDLLANTQGRRWWRRLFTRPGAVNAQNPLIGGDPRRRRFDGVLAHLVGMRDDGRCRDPFCDAPLRHTDHITQARAGGPTSFTNGRGVCVRGNLVREMPGWDVELIHDGLGREPHTVRTTTPTGHTYLSRAGP